MRWSGTGSSKQQRAITSKIFSRAEASGEAEKPALPEAAVAGHDTVLPVPVPAEVEAADAVDTDTRLNHTRIGAFYRVVSRPAPRTSFQRLLTRRSIQATAEMPAPDTSAKAREEKLCSAPDSLSGFSKTLDFVGV